MRLPGSVPEYAQPAAESAQAFVALMSTQAAVVPPMRASGSAPEPEQPAVAAPVPGLVPEFAAAEGPASYHKRPARAVAAEEGPASYHKRPARAVAAEGP